MKVQGAIRILTLFQSELLMLDWRCLSHLTILNLHLLTLDVRHAIIYLASTLVDLITIYRYMATHDSFECVIFHLAVDRLGDYLRGWGELLCLSIV